MITLVEALQFRSLRYVSQPLGPFHVLVGPNASGKTTFLDVVAFLGDLVSGGIEKAVGERTANFQDLTWRRQGDRFELAVEARIPEELRQKLGDPAHDTVRYEVALRLDAESQEIRFDAETLTLRKARIGPSAELESFPNPRPFPGSLLLGTQSAVDARVVIGRDARGNTSYYSEANWGKRLFPGLKPSNGRSAIDYFPEDQTLFPASTWLKSLLADGVRRLILNSLLIRQASPPGQGKTYRPDGSNLPWVVAELERQSPQRIRDWIAHLQTALPDLESVRTVERPDDKHRYLMLGYRGGVEIPSWMVSDGTLRLMALTLPAYLTELSGIYLIEEPENGIHPRAIETMYQSLSSVYGAQILLATHSPVILSLVELPQLLCFAKSSEGATDIVAGSDHPALKEWRRETSLSVLFASGVLGYGE